MRTESEVSSERMRHYSYVLNGCYEELTEETKENIDGYIAKIAELLEIEVNWFDDLCVDSQILEELAKNNPNVYCKLLDFLARIYCYLPLWPKEKLDEFWRNRNNF